MRELKASVIMLIVAICIILGYILVMEYAEWKQIVYRFCVAEEKENTVR